MMRRCFATTKKIKRTPAIVVTYPRHVLLMLCCVSRTIQRKKLGVFFEIDQSTVCRYLQFCNKILWKILPTPQDQRKYQNARLEDLKEFISGHNTGVLIVGGTHIPICRSGDKGQRKKTFGGKKKRFTLNTTVIISINNIILAINKTVVGTTHDIPAQGGSASIWCVG